MSVCAGSVCLGLSWSSWLLLGFVLFIGLWVLGQDHGARSRLWRVVKTSLVLVLGCVSVMTLLCLGCIFVTFVWGIAVSGQG